MDKRIWCSYSRMVRSVRDALTDGAMEPLYIYEETTLAVFGCPPSFLGELPRAFGEEYREAARFVKNWAAHVAPRVLFEQRDDCTRLTWGETKTALGKLYGLNGDGDGVEEAVRNAMLYLNYSYHDSDRLAGSIPLLEHIADHMGYIAMPRR